jgi:hypothetical protein
LKRKLESRYKYLYQYFELLFVASLPCGYDSFFSCPCSCCRSCNQLTNVVIWAHPGRPKDYLAATGMPGCPVDSFTPSLDSPSLQVSELCINCRATLDTDRVLLKSQPRGLVTMLGAACLRRLRPASVCRRTITPHPLLFISAVTTEPCPQPSFSWLSSGVRLSSSSGVQSSTKASSASWSEEWERVGLGAHKADLTAAALNRLLFVSKILC